MQSEANNYSTAMAPTENHDSMLCMADMLHEAKVYSWASNTGLCAITNTWICLCFSGGSASACCTGIKESWVWTGSGDLQLLGSIGKLAETQKATLGTTILQ